jgi:hypothetical protein
VHLGADDRRALDAREILERGAGQRRQQIAADPDIDLTRALVDAMCVSFD